MCHATQVCYIETTMHDRRQFIRHNSKTIICLDYTNLAGKAYIDAIRASEESAGTSDINDRLILVDATDSVVDKEVLQALKSLSAKASEFTDRTAVVGVSGIQMLFMRAIAKLSKSKMRPFSSREEALEWLTEPIKQ